MLDPCTRRDAGHPFGPDACVQVGVEVRFQACRSVPYERHGEQMHVGGRSVEHGGEGKAGANRGVWLSRRRPAGREPGGEVMGRELSMCSKAP